MKLESTHEITVSTCSHPHSEAGKKPVLGAAFAGLRVVGDGVAPTRTKLGLFGLLLHGGCSWQDIVQCQARKLQTKSNVFKTVLVIGTVFQKHLRKGWVDACGSLVASSSLIPVKTIGRWLTALFILFKTCTFVVS